MTKTDFDTCDCGDYRLDHVEGGCKMCAQSNAPWDRDGCRSFRLHRLADEIPEAWRLTVVPDA